jgi:hypothetical protein
MSAAIHYILRATQSNEKNVHVASTNGWVAMRTGKSKVQAL